MCLTRASVLGAITWLGECTRLSGEVPSIVSFYAISRYSNNEIKVGSFRARLTKNAGSSDWRLGYFSPNKKSTAGIEAEHVWAGLVHIKRSNQ